MARWSLEVNRARTLDIYRVQPPATVFAPAPHTGPLSRGEAPRLNTDPRPCARTVGGPRGRGGASTDTNTHTSK